MSVAARLVATAAHALPATRAHRLVTLIYHRVHPQPDRMFPGEVDSVRFAWQMALLRRHCHVLPLADAAARMRSGSLPPRAVAVTFDDGYADNETTALPILERFGIVATFFVAPGFLDGGRMWNDSVIESVRRAPGTQLDLTEFGLGIRALGAEEARGAVAEDIIRAIKHQAPEVRREMVEELSRRIGADLPSDLMMTSAQVRRLASAGMAIGAHTMTHPILRTLDEAAAEREIRASRETLEAITGHPVRAFAYPNGRPGNDYTERDRNLVARLGFDFALSTVRGAATAASDLFQLPRFTPWDPTPVRWLTRLLLTFGLGA